MISYYFGSIGCGKTSVATCIALKEYNKIVEGRSKYKHVLTNFETDFSEIISWDDIGQVYLEDCLILLDESQIFADCRDYKKFGKDKTNFLALSRHYNCDLIFFSQSWGDSDKKIRSLCTHLYYVRSNYLFHTSVCKRVFREIIVDELTHDIVDGYRFPTLREFFVSIIAPSKIGKLRWVCHRRLYYNHFDSYSRPLDLTDFNFQSWLDQS